jgi:hypothetical protein
MSPGQSVVILQPHKTRCPVSERGRHILRFGLTVIAARVVRGGTSVPMPSFHRLPSTQATEISLSYFHFWKNNSLVPGIFESKRKRAIFERVGAFQVHLGLVRNR